MTTTGGAPLRFDSDAFRRAYLAGLGARGADDVAYDAQVETTLDALAAHLEAHVDLDLLYDMAQTRNVSPAGQTAVGRV